MCFHAIKTTAYIFTSDPCIIWHTSEPPPRSCQHLWMMFSLLFRIKGKKLEHFHDEFERQLCHCRLSIFTYQVLAGGPRES